MSAARSPVVDPAWVAERVDDPAVRVIEIDVSPAAYAAGHIPGAVLWDAYGDLRDADLRTIPRAALGRLVRRAGVGRETTVVFSGYGAALGYWLLTAHGHPDVRLLPGPRERYVEAGFPFSAEVPRPAETHYSLAGATPDALATLPDVRDALDDPAQILLDVRSEAEFRGERFWPSGAPEEIGRPGRVPGAVHVPIDALWDEGGGTPATLDQLRRAGAPPEARVIVYCTVGNRASQAWFALTEQLGYPDVRVYYGSWAEYGRTPEAPVEGEPVLSGGRRGGA
jgi:thiosulfate/3-mercaptopyruvate sulfurtransferase